MNSHSAKQSYGINFFLFVFLLQINNQIISSWHRHSAFINYLLLLLLLLLFGLQREMCNGTPQMLSVWSVWAAHQSKSVHMGFCSSLCFRFVIIGCNLFSSHNEMEMVAAFKWIQNRDKTFWVSCGRFVHTYICGIVSVNWYTCVVVMQASSKSECRERSCTQWEKLNCSIDRPIVGLFLFFICHWLLLRRVFILLAI